MSGIRLREFAKLCGISTNGVMKAINDGRISHFTKDKKGYLFDQELALQEYLDNTNRNLSNNEIFDSFESDLDENDRGEKSVLDIEPKYWNVQQALQAKTIYQAMKVEHELEVEKGKYYLKKVADAELHRISNTMARGLLNLPVKLKQKHSDLSDEIYNDLKNLCEDLSKETESKL